MCKYFWEKNYIDQFLIPPCLPLQSKGETAPSIFVFRKVLDCKHLKQIKGGWPVHPTLFPGFQSFQQQPSVWRKEGGPVEYKRDRRSLCLWLCFKARSKQLFSKWPTPILGNLRRKGGVLEMLKAAATGDRGQRRGHSPPLSVWNSDMWAFHSKTVQTSASFHVGRGVIIFCFVCLSWFR